MLLPVIVIAVLVLPLVHMVMVRVIIGFAVHVVIFLVERGMVKVVLVVATPIFGRDVVTVKSCTVLVIVMHRVDMSLLRLVLVAGMPLLGLAPGSGMPQRMVTIRIVVRGTGGVPPARSPEIVQCSLRSTLGGENQALRGESSVSGRDGGLQGDACGEQAALSQRSKKRSFFAEAYDARAESSYVRLPSRRDCRGRGAGRDDRSKARSVARSALGHADADQDSRNGGRGRCSVVTAQDPSAGREPRRSREAGRR
jgi:hypothetical protein